MIRSETITMIREIALKGKSAYAIGKELGISKNTAKKYMKPGSDSPTKLPRPSKLDPYKDAVNKMMASGTFNCVVIYEHIRNLGYNGQISILKDYVHPFRPPKAIPAVQRYETLPGKQAQMDWGICSYVDEDGISHKIPCFAMILGHSRMRYIEFTKRSDLYSLLHCMLNAFEYYGGIPDIVLTDNMKTVVLGRESGNPIWNPAFLDFANTMGFVPKVCKVRRPQTKGKVERLVRYIKENFIPGREFKDLGDLNRQALIWCESVNRKVIRSQGIIPVNELPAEELNPLPELVIRDRYRYESRHVSRDGFISYDGVLYGIPWEYSGKTITVIRKKGRIECLDGLTLIASHPIEYCSGRLILLEGQYKGLAERNGLSLMLPHAAQTSEAVEERPLGLYEELLEASNG